MESNVYLKDVAQIIPCLLDKKQGKEQSTWISPASLQQYNVITNYTIDSFSQKKENLRICDNDILIKRVNPSFVNYISEIKKDIYAHNNLFIVRANAEIHPKYLAYLLNNTIADIFTQRSSHSNLIAITFKELEKIIIPLLTKKEQECIGNAWFYSIEKFKLAKKIAHLELTKEAQLLKNFIRSK